MVCCLAILAQVGDAHKFIESPASWPLLACCDTPGRAQQRRRRAASALRAFQVRFSAAPIPSRLALHSLDGTGSTSRPVRTDVKRLSPAPAGPFLRPALALPAAVVR